MDTATTPEPSSPKTRSKARTIGRRAFLVSSVVIAGGVAFGYYTVKKPHLNPLRDQLGPDEATFNPWVKISPKGITLITPHADIGQGVASMQAALIAEEMDLDFGQFEISQGTPSAAYYNTALAGETVPFLRNDHGIVAESVRTIADAMVKVMGMQSTGGSSSTIDSFVKLRTAGAVARETLKEAAFKRTGIPVRDLRTASGAVILPDATKIPYTQLAGDAAKLSPVTDVVLRDPSQWRLIGKKMERLDIVPKSTGTLTYGIDLDFKGMLYAAVKVSPRIGAARLGYDASKAKAMRGVKAILEIPNGVAVIADNTWRAFQAADAITFTWGKAPYPPDQDAHWAEVGRSFTKERLDKEWRHEGDVDRALSGAKVIEAEYRAPYVAHQPLEPLSAVIKVTDGRADLWTASQAPGIAQQKAAEVTGLPLENVHVYNQYAGGSFGHRLEFDHVKLAAEIGRQMKGQVIKMTFSREEDFTHDYPRQIAMARPRGTVKNGRVETCDLHIAAVSAARSYMSRLGTSIPGADLMLAAGAWDLPYKIPNFRVTTYAVPELAPVSSWRSVGPSTSAFFADCFLDELIHAAGADPMEERLRLTDDPEARRVLETVARMSNWGSSLGPNRGRGVAFATTLGTPVAEVVEVWNTPDGIQIEKVYVAAEVGRIVDPVNFENHVQGGVVWGLGHAMNCEITYADGMIQQPNYHVHEAMRLRQCPEIIVKGIETSAEIRGIGEPPVPPAAPALANAIFAATGKRIREMPFNKHINFV
ncbi:xanthine dehydrogenase family protein molybdopterin-binding subunit [Sphingobium subterraneum]|uniref:Isoquinoline 1-oxidoreductase beta subunit n=1 Tax=Sphingobium subterraneum TaxID=627688 RepID=A0A841IWP5_9SPHN|nr:molybdopterin cofactor-binding domain-containing protein [Sphingobium subterraneum]MBB6123359.1 isoquinoline 1-oxidoreductase beta subunit [Sphingobium subterraneum]